MTVVFFLSLSLSVAILSLAFHSSFMQCYLLCSTSHLVGRVLSTGLYNSLSFLNDSLPYLLLFFSGQKLIFL